MHLNLSNGGQNFTIYFLVFTEVCLFAYQDDEIIKLPHFQPADVYLIDEPSAHLDSEQRLHAAKVIKRFAFCS